MEGDLRFLVIIISNLTNDQRNKTGIHYLIRKENVHDLLDSWKADHKS